mgnify:CR=1 FL=1
MDNLNRLILEQATVLLYSGLLGIVLGAAYDVFRIVRMIINSKSITIFIQDVSYFIVSGLITFFFVLKTNSGDSRFYIIIGEGIGWIVYHLTVGEFVYKCSNGLVMWVKHRLKSLGNEICKRFSKKPK